MRTIRFIYAIFGIAFAARGQQYALVPFPDVNKRKSMTVYKSYYNSLSIFMDNTPMEQIRIDAVDCEIIKSNSIFYIRVKKDMSSFFVKLFKNEQLVDSILTFVAPRLPLPELRHRKEANYEFHNVYKYDSIYLSGYFHDDMVCFKNKRYDFNGNEIFKILKFDAIIQENGKEVFSESNVGNKYSELFKRTVINYHYSRPSEDKLIIRNATIQDDLGNIYVYPDLFYNLGRNF